MYRPICGRWVCTNVCAFWHVIYTLTQRADPLSKCFFWKCRKGPGERTEMWKEQSKEEDKQTGRTPPPPRWILTDSCTVQRNWRYLVHKAERQGMLDSTQTPLRGAYILRCARLRQAFGMYWVPCGSGRWARNIVKQDSCKELTGSVSKFNGNCLYLLENEAIRVADIATIILINL
jgi:hypothetical protein